MSGRPIIAALGDSLTEGEHTDGTFIFDHAWPAYLSAALFPDAGVCNFGIGGNTVEQADARSLADIEGKGFEVINDWIYVNNSLALEAAPSIIAKLDALITRQLAAGLLVNLCTTPGCFGYVGWSQQAQDSMDGVRAWILALVRTGVTVTDLYLPYPLGMNNPANPRALYPPFAHTDFLHINPAGGKYLGQNIMAPRYRALFPVFGGPALRILQQSSSGLQQVILISTTPHLHVVVQLPDGTSERVYDDGFNDGYTGQVLEVAGFTQLWITRAEGWPAGPAAFSANS